MECQRGLAMRKLSIRLSVRVFVCQTRKLWQNWRKICPDFIPYERLLSLVFWEEWLEGGDPHYLQFWVNRPQWSEIADFEPIFARIASALTPSEKNSTNTNRKSTARFLMSLRWSPYVVSKPPKKGGSKTQKGRFSPKITLRLKKVCYKVSLCENCQQQSCKAFIGLTICAKIGGGDPFYLKFWSTWPHWSAIADFRSLFTRSGSDVTPSEKVQLTLIGSSLRAFQWTQDEHHTLSVSPPKVDSKTQNVWYPPKIALRLKEVCYKVFFCVKTDCDRVVGHSLT